MPFKVLLVFGTRPEAIKMSPLAKKLTQNPLFDVRVCVTGQHREMLDQVLALFNIRPDYDLNLMKSQQTLEWLTAAIIEGTSKVIDDFSPQLVLVHGDTTTSFAAALAAFYKKVDIGHVEAGLRTGDLMSPWPEEANRRLTATLATHHFAPTQTAANNLLAEGYSEGTIHITGNTVIDALLQTVTANRASSKKPTKLTQLLTQVEHRKVILITGHRRENFGQGFENICLALQKIAQTHPDVALIYPVHLNPQVQAPVNQFLDGIKSIHLIPPQDYPSFVELMDRADIILTDSGGVQEEAPALNKPVLVLRDKTERCEALTAGTISLVGTNTETIFNAVTTLLEQPQSFKNVSNPYGDGQASELIQAQILQYYGLH
ncbi:UDP-N-acetylglucosamine 2-epimerase (non-hydrolyzing) [Shewanella sp. 10N.7]|uniref:non-hydrolyzing UDP-N-acetylglucosamine 2-epimerase n=1 Tax=Shewanella sp. 10N.7 TaxID=2885093 RepID=UPI001E448C24|nr:UDP-N-acetylglucosamine 2-epimerase (non-hydrolyzing) [Shewanella sp. 10N.7]MCC4833562.1 UDP-N-acetylglucosamine 2-epimerase (non-hydrolyzing) [Shewanella sp. 10N.7]